MLHAFQADADQPQRGNHDAGKILFGPDGKLYFQIGDQGRRGQLQNLASGPLGPGQPDDQFGGPAPDDAHLTGVIFRLNPDGTTPSDNPFANVTAQQMAQLEQQAGVTLTPAELDDVVANIQKIFSYGRRNGFGLAFDPMSGFLWESENGDDGFDEMNRITAGSNAGWIQIMGPASRVAEFQQIESSFTPLQGNLPVNGNLPFSPIDPTTFIPALQQVRWPPSLIAGDPSQAMQRLFVLPGSHYDDPEFSWRWAVAPAAIGFAASGLGPDHANDLFVGGSRTFLDEGYLFEFKFDPSRQHFAFSDPKLADKVDDNDYKFDEGESASLVAGKNFGIVTNIVTGPDGNLYVTSLTNGAVYMISAAVRQSVNQRFVAQVYRDLLHREADPGGLTAFSGLLDQGSFTRTQVVQAIQNSREYRTIVVETLYQTLLRRTADQSGLNGWISFLNQGGTTQELEARIIGSDEYFARRASGNNDGFLRAAYLDILGRAIDPTGAQGWGNELRGNVSRTEVARMILSSVESNLVETENLYNQFLHRAADPRGLNATAVALHQGMANELATAIIVGSDEYLSRV